MLKYSLLLSLSSPRERDEEMENTTEDRTEGQTENADEALPTGAKRPKDQSLDEWLAEERARLDKGFTFEPQPTSAPIQPGTAEQALAGLGLGAGVAAGVAAPHPNPVIRDAQLHPIYSSSGWRAPQRRSASSAEATCASIGMCAARAPSPVTNGTSWRIRMPS